MCDRAKCIFCRICDNLENNEIVYSDEQVIAFHDIKPVAKTHLLIVPREHIKNAKSLTSTDKELVEHLVDVGKQLLNNSESGKVDDSLIGFHWPPLTSINHLHLHVISPASEMKLVHWLQFKPNSFWFVSVMSGDGLPGLICLECLRSLLIAFEFKLKCEKTDAMLREYIENNLVPMQVGTTVYNKSVTVDSNTLVSVGQTNHTNTGGPGGNGGGSGNTNGGEIKQIVGTNELISTIPTISINNANTIYSNTNPYIIPMVECDVLVKEEQDGNGGTTTSGIVSDGSKIYHKTTEGGNIMLKKIESGNLTPVNTTVDMAAFSSRLISSEMIQQAQPSQITIYGGEFRDLIRVSEEQHQHQQQTIIMPAGAVTSMAAAQCNVLTTNSYTIDHHQQQQQQQQQNQQQCSTSTIIQQNNCTTTVAAASAAVATSNNNFISTMTIPTFTTVKDRKRQLSTTTINCKKSDNDSTSSDTTNEQQHSIINHQNTTISSPTNKKPKTFNHHKKKTVYSVVVPSSTCDNKIINRLNKKDCKNNNQSIQCGGGKRTITSGGGNETIQQQSQDIVVSSGETIDNSDSTQKNLKDNNIYYHTQTTQQGYIR